MLSIQLLKCNRHLHAKCIIEQEWESRHTKMTCSFRMKSIYKDKTYTVTIHHQVMVYQTRILNIRNNIGNAALQL